MEHKDKVFQLTGYLKEFTRLTGENLIQTLDPLTAIVDRDLHVGNLGNNAVVNALIYVLDVYIAKMSSYDRPEQENDLYNQIHKEHGKYLSDLIAKYSSTKKSYLIEIPDEEGKSDTRTDGPSDDSGRGEPVP